MTVVEGVAPVSGPFAADAAADVLRTHTVAGHETHRSGVHTRAVRTPGGIATVTITLAAGREGVPWVMDVPRGTEVEPVLGIVRRWLDLDADVERIDRALAGDPSFAVSVRTQPGIRVLGCTDWFETAVQVVLGQQVSLAAAATFAARLVGAYGEAGPSGLRAYPSAATLAAADVDDVRTVVGLTRTRARTVTALAGAVAVGLAPGPHIRRELLALPGIGPWTVDYLALRAFGDRDAFPASDLVLRKLMGGGSPAALTARAEAWRPWRAYAASRVWAPALASRRAP